MCDLIVVRTFAHSIVQRLAAGASNRLHLQKALLVELFQASKAARPSTNGHGPSAQVIATARGKEARSRRTAAAIATARERLRSTQA